MPGSPPLPAPLRGALFDLDGTLVDSEPLHHESAVRVLARFGHDLRAADFSGYVGWAELPFWAELQQRYSLAGTPAELADLRTAEYLELVHGRSIEPLPGVTELLEELRRRGVPCAVASSSPRPQIEASLAGAGLAEFFPHRLSGHDDVARGKPEPDVFLAAAAAIGAPASACIAVEDSATGVAAAVASGAYTVVIPNLGRPDPSWEWAALRLESAAELLGLLLDQPGGVQARPAP